MVFTSPKFLLFLATVLLLLRLVQSHRGQKRVLSLASCVFYAAWDWRYLGLLLVISGIDFVAGSNISSTEDQRIRRRWLLLSIFSNIGVLAYFKYCNFFVENLRGLLRVNAEALPSLNILLPAGISFYTFKTLSYTIDVYRRDLKPCKSWLDYFMFVTFFPELIAGPIVRASVFLPQLFRDLRPTWERLNLGMGIFLQGLVKKLLIADRLALVVDPVFAKPDLYSAASLWCAVVGYGMQIYCDFAGYSDMAIGTARMMGLELPENFRMPYLACNVSEFWRRWHITLSTWLRDFLYIPLGGNRGTFWRVTGNLMITMLLGGLWHGASWAFVLWGGLHGVALVVNRWWARGPGKRFGLPQPVAWVITLSFIMMTWVPFRAGSSGDAFLIYARMFGLHGNAGVSFVPDALWWCLSLVILGHAVGISLAERPSDSFCVSGGSVILKRLGLSITESAISGRYCELERSTVAGVYLLGMVLLVLFLFSPTNTNPFVYFQF
jgi:alginate O-acetyltransferase complex protein AlgI